MTKKHHELDSEQELLPPTNTAGRIAGTRGFFNIFDTLNGGAKPTELCVSDFPGSKDGDIVAEGVVKISLGSLTGLGYDSEYLKTDDGGMLFDNMIFRGLPLNSRVLLIRKGDGFEVRRVELAEDSSADHLRRSDIEEILRNDQ